MSDSSPPVLSLNRLTKRYGDKLALSNVSFSVPQGAAVALVGGNGAGKSTLIKTVLGFVHGDGGSVEIMGTPHDQTKARAQLSYLPERFNPPHFFTGLDFLNYMCTLHEVRFDKAAAIERCEALELDSTFLTKSIRTYSKGMTQKLGLVATFLANRQLLIFDEPMSGLDPKARVLFKQALFALKDAGKTLFFSTHQLADVEELCDTIAILEQGELIFLGSPQGCLEKFPAETLEKSYIQCVEKRGLF
uniref:Putative ATP binding cassette transporter, ATP-binding protein n=1 Tax=Magnetococcus massalia (strain MO-1) TaxID=451514 RepID=A0A1S7LLS8_MAGMO|nr:putative ATP binding cassette transporter, ATP-binding protein [Candidatus Magnetococcus massalia]